LERYERYLPRLLGTAIKPDGARRQGENGVTVRQSMGRIQGPRQTGMPGAGGPLALGNIKHSIRSDHDERGIESLRRGRNPAARV
jgi:hypothetical protein